MAALRFDHFYPPRDLDASHPDVVLDRNRCILCALCVRASREIDGKDVFAIAGRGLQSRIVVNAPSGRLGDTESFDRRCGGARSARSARSSSSERRTGCRSASGNTTCIGIAEIAVAAATKSGTGGDG